MIQIFIKFPLILERHKSSPYLFVVSANTNFTILELYVSFKNNIALYYTLFDSITFQYINHTVL